MCVHMPVLLEAGSPLQITTEARVTGSIGWAGMVLGTELSLWEVWQLLLTREPHRLAPYPHLFFSLEAKISACLMRPTKYEET